jgi:hypothetical protein
MKTTFIDNAECPKGHKFTIRRRFSSCGYVVSTRCPACERNYDLFVAEAPRPAPTRKLSERDIEAHLVRRVQELGGEIRKVQWIGRVGAPDRLVMLPPVWVLCSDGNNRVDYRKSTIWVEIKAPGLAALFPRNAHERTQHREHERMRKMGQRVEVVDSYERIEEILR